MIVPRMTAGMKQERRFARLGVGSRDVWAFVMIAHRATVSQVVFDSETTMRFGNDVFDMKRHRACTLWQAAVFATATGALLC